MYRIKYNGIITYSEYVQFIKMHASGNYTSATEEEAEGISVLVPSVVVNPDSGKQELQKENIALRILPDGLTGKEPLVTYQYIDGEIEMKNTTDVLNTSVSTIAEVTKMRKVIETAAQNGLTDQEASVAPTLFPSMPLDGKEIKPGFRICWEGRALKAAVTCWAREDNDPDHAPNLWEELPYKDGYRIIPETITVTGAFDQGEKGWWKDALYQSKVDANVYTPEQYPDNWDKI